MGLLTPEPGDPMSDACPHIADLDVNPAPNSTGCEECMATGGHWVHLRLCQACGHVGCCDNSPGKHATGHFHDTFHPIVRSFEPDEDWFWCYVDEFAFVLDVPPGPSYL
jgi:hypothetical protein